MGDDREFYYEPDGSERLTTAVVRAVAEAHDEDPIDQTWVLGREIDTDALDRIFREHSAGLRLQFEADATTATIIGRGDRNPVIRIESHR